MSDNGSTSVTEPAAATAAEPNSEQLQLADDQQRRDALHKLITTGNLNNLTREQEVAYYLQVCEQLNLNPATQPFRIIEFTSKQQGRQRQLYALKSCSDQLRRRDGISIDIVDEGLVGNTLYRVVAKATIPGSRGKPARHDTDEGVVSIANLSPEYAANAIKRAVTQAKRRVTLSICGLGFLDESEAYDLPEAAARLPGESSSAAALTESKAEPQPQPAVETKDAASAWNQAADRIDELQAALGIQTEDMRARLIQLYGTDQFRELKASQLREVLTKLEAALEQQKAKETKK